MSFKRIFTIVLAAIMIAGSVGLLSFADEAEEFVADISWYDSENPQTEYILDTKEELAGFAKLVNEGNSFSGKTIKLSADIDMSNVNNWTPIGTSTANAFKGTFDGCDNIVSNLTITRDAAYGNGFFGNILGGAVVKNITFDNILVRRYEDERCSGNIYGVVTGYTYGSTLFENVTVKNSKVVGYGKVAALIGMSAEPGNHTTSLINCRVENTELKGTYNVAGLVGTVLNNNVVTTSTAVKNVTWTPGDAETAYREFSGNLSDGTAFDGLYWMYGEDAYAGWSDFYNDWYIQYQADGYLTEGVEADGLCHNAEASISGYAYETLKEATDAAEALIEEGEENVTIQLLCDVNTQETLTFDKDVTLDLGEKTFKPSGVNSGDGWNVNITGGADVKIINGTIDLSSVTGGWHGIFGIGNGSLTLDDTVKVAGSDITGNIFALTSGESVITFNGTTVEISDQAYSDGTYFIKSEPDSGIPTVVMNEADITIANGQGFINNSCVEISDSVINLSAMRQHGFRNISGVISNTVIDLDTSEDGIKNTGEQLLEIKDESTVNITAQNPYNISDSAVLSMHAGKYSADPAEYVVDDFEAIFDEDKQLYIIIPEKVTVTFNTNEGSEIPPVIVDSNVLVNLSSYIPTKAGYVFAGWYADEELTEKVTEISLLADKTLYAAWEKKRNSSAGLTGPVLSSKNEQKDLKQIILTIGDNTAVVFGEKVENDVVPVIRNERTMLPIRFVAEALGAKVEWNEEKREVLITTDKVTILITIDSNIALVGGKEVSLDSAAFIENGRTYLPLRFISENLGAKVEWNEKNKQVTITKQ